MCLRSGAGPQAHIAKMIAAASFTGAVEGVWTACTLPESRSTWFWITSKPATVVGRRAIQSIPIIPPRRNGSGRGWRSLRWPPRSALVRWHVWHERTYSATPTSWLTQKARGSTRYPVFGPPKVPPERAVMAVAEHLRAQPAAGGDAEAVRSALSAAEEEATTHQKRPALRCALVVGDGGAVPSLPCAAAAPRRIGPKIESRSSSVAKVCTNVGERKGLFEGKEGVPSRRESDEHTSTRGG